jgi:Na+/proline symporter
MLLWFVIIYWIISVAIGLYAARWVHNSKDFAVAGRRMPMYIVTATVFATVVRVGDGARDSGDLRQGRLLGIIADPFGSSLCLILVGLFFARPLYACSSSPSATTTASATAARWRC